jgi:hypothetical protein
MLIDLLDREPALMAINASRSEVPAA